MKNYILSGGEMSTPHSGPATSQQLSDAPWCFAPTLLSWFHERNLFGRRSRWNIYCWCPWCGALPTRGLEGSPASIHKQAISGNKTLMVKVPGQLCSYCILVQNINIFLYSHALFAVYYIFNSLFTLQIFIFDKLYIVSYPNIMGMGTGRDHPKGAFQKNLSRSFSPKACKHRWHCWSRSSSDMAPDSTVYKNKEGNYTMPCCRDF